MARHHLFNSAGGLTYSLLQEADHFRVQTTQDVTPILDLNAKLRTANDGYSPSRELRRVAQVPYVVMAKWRDEEGWDPWDMKANADKWAQKLNDPDWAHLRSADGRIGVTNGVLR